MAQKIALTLLLLALMILPAVAVIRTRLDRARSKLKQEESALKKPD